MPLHFFSRKKKAAVVVLLMLNKVRKLEKRRKRTRIWSRDWFQEGKDGENGTQECIPKEMPESLLEEYRSILHMSEESFKHLLALVTPYIRKQDTCMRKAITAEQRLGATLTYLATGKSLQDLKFTTGISPQALGKIIPETCAAIVESLKDEYMKFPSTEEEWMAIGKDFEDLWNFPNCGGVLDGKHVRITPPTDSGSVYVNSKGFFSVVLTAIVNAKHEFIMVDIGKNGHVTDGEVIERTTFHQRLITQQLSLPSKDQTTAGMNFVFLASEAFAMQENLLKPFPEESLDTERRIFNYRHSRASRVAENAFGILADRFRIFHTPIHLRMDKIDLVVFACCMLHNYLYKHNASAYMPPQSLTTEDIEDGTIKCGDWKTETAAMAFLQPAPFQFSADAAEESRKHYMQYFNGSGAVSWQQNMIM